MGTLCRSVLDEYLRRVCPGRHFAEASFFINVATVLHVFNVTPPVDSNGRPMQLTPDVTSGFVWYVLRAFPITPPNLHADTGTYSYPLPFKCTIKPRSAAAEAVIQGAERAAA